MKELTQAEQETLERILKAFNFQGSSMFFPIGNGRNAEIKKDDIKNIIKW